MIHVISQLPTLSRGISLSSEPCFKKTFPGKQTNHKLSTKWIKFFPLFWQLLWLKKWQLKMLIKQTDCSFVQLRFLATSSNIHLQKLGVVHRARPWTRSTKGSTDWVHRGGPCFVHIPHSENSWWLDPSLLFYT